MVDLSTKKIPVFTGINDNPVAPTSTAGGNGSHLIRRYNELVDLVQAQLNQTVEVTDTLVDEVTLAEATLINLASEIQGLALIAGSGIPNFPTTVHPNNLALVVNSITGNDLTGDGTASTPYLTIAKALSILEEKLLPEFVSIELIGTFSESLHFENLYALSDASTLAVTNFGNNSGSPEWNFAPVESNNLVFRENQSKQVKVQLNQFNLQIADYGIRANYAKDLSFDGLTIEDTTGNANNYFTIQNSNVFFTNVATNGQGSRTFLNSLSSTITTKSGLNLLSYQRLFNLTNSILNVTDNVAGANNNTAIRADSKSEAYLFGKTIESGVYYKSDNSSIRADSPTTDYTTDTFDLFIPIPANQDYVFSLSTVYFGTIVEVIYKTSAGSITAAIVDNNELVAISGLSCDSNLQNSLINPNFSFSKGQSLLLRLTDNVGAANLAVTLISRKGAVSISTEPNS